MIRLTNCTPSVRVWISVFLVLWIGTVCYADDYVDPLDAQPPTPAPKKIAPVTTPKPKPPVTTAKPKPPVTTAKPKPPVTTAASTKPPTTAAQVTTAKITTLGVQSTKQTTEILTSLSTGITTSKPKVDITTEASTGNLASIITTSSGKATGSEGSSQGSASNTSNAPTIPTSAQTISSAKLVPTTPSASGNTETDSNSQEKEKKKKNKKNKASNENKKGRMRAPRYNAKADPLYKILSITHADKAAHNLLMEGKQALAKICFRKKTRYSCDEEESLPQHDYDPRDIGSAIDKFITSMLLYLCCKTE